jgi:hypothetical protein
MIPESMLLDVKYGMKGVEMIKTVSETTTGPVAIPPYFYDGNLLLAEKVGSQVQKIYINDGSGIIGMVRPIYDGSNNLTHYQRLYYLTTQ